MNSKEIVESGLLELYALGDLKGPEFDIVDRAVSNDPSLLTELNKIEDSLFLYQGCPVKTLSDHFFLSLRSGILNSVVIRI